MTSKTYEQLNEQEQQELHWSAELHFAEQRYEDVCEVLFELIMQDKINFHDISKVNDVASLAQTIIEAGIRQVRSKHLNLTDEEWQQAKQKREEKLNVTGLETLIRPNLNIVEQLRNKTK